MRDFGLRNGIFPPFVFVGRPPFLCLLVGFLLFPPSFTRNAPITASALHSRTHPSGNFEEVSHRLLEILGQSGHSSTNHNLLKEVLRIPTISSLPALARTCELRTTATTTACATAKLSLTAVRRMACVLLRRAPRTERC